MFGDKDVKQNTMVGRQREPIRVLWKQFSAGVIAWMVLAGTSAVADPTAVADSTVQTHRVLLLPPAFTEFQNAVSGFEVIPDWTEAARHNLGEAARMSLQIAGLELAPLPNITAEESTVVRNHLAVAQLIVAAGALYDGWAWHDQRANFDRSLGDGLRFLHERSGADYALFIYGAQVRQTSGRVGMRILSTLAAATVHVGLLTTGGGGQVVNVCLLDLNDGTVVWFNSSETKNVFGSAGSDMRDMVATQAAMRALFASYPNIPAFAD